MTGVEKQVVNVSDLRTDMQRLRISSHDIRSQQNVAQSWNIFVDKRIFAEMDFDVIQPFIENVPKPLGGNEGHNQR